MLLFTAGNVIAFNDFDAGDVERSPLQSNVQAGALGFASENIFIERTGESYNIRFPVQYYFKGASLNMRSEEVAEPLRKLSNFILKYVSGPIYIQGVFVHNDRFNVDQQALIQSQISELADYMWKDKMFASAIYMTTKEVQRRKELGFWHQNAGLNSFIEIKFRAAPGVLPIEFEN